MPKAFALPEGPLAQSTTDPNILYGTTEGGGGGGGTLFSYNLGTGAETVLNDSPPLGSPVGSLLQSGNLLYSYNGLGGLFSFNLANSGLALLDSFAKGEGAPVMLGDVLYGAGGGTGNGTIRSYNLDTGIPATLYSFTGGTDGAGPDGPLVLSGTTLYGMTEDGGTNGLGTIFSYDLNTGDFNTLFTFATATGAHPQGGLLVDGTTLYGTTGNSTLSVGGLGAGGGVVFSFDTSTDTYTILHNFTQTDGNDLTGNLTLIGNTLYGTAPEGGANGDGTIFSIALPEPGTLAIFAAGACVLLRRRDRRG